MGVPAWVEADRPSAAVGGPRLFVVAMSEATAAPVTGWASCDNDIVLFRLLWRGKVSPSRLTPSSFAVTRMRLIQSD